jgi:hypothetical protein
LFSSFDTCHILFFYLSRLLASCLLFSLLTCHSNLMFSPPSCPGSLLHVIMFVFCDNVDACCTYIVHNYDCASLLVLHSNGYEKFNSAYSRLLLFFFPSVLLSPSVSLYTETSTPSCFARFAATLPQP